MGVYGRFKKNPDGLRKLVELLELTPAVRRQKMIDVGMAEDPEYTRQALQFVMTFKDVLELPEMEMSELCAKAPPRFLAFALHTCPDDIKQRFLRCCKPAVAAEVRDFLDAKVTTAEIGGAQLKIVETARDLERKGYVHCKKIPI
jgi:flagellar motor switch protein FliG